MLVSRDPVKVQHPHEKDTWFEIVQLSWKQLKKARRRAVLENAEVAKAFGAAFVKALGEDETGEAAMRVMKKQEQAEKQDPASFDTETMLRHGLVGWSYKAKLDDESREELDDETAEWLKVEILNISKPPSERELKN